MIRTQISLEPEDIGWLKRQAKTHGVSLAGMIRRLIRTAAAKVERERARPKTIPGRERRKMTARFAFIGCIKDGSETDAKLAEDYLYAEGEVR